MPCVFDFVRGAGVTLLFLMASCSTETEAETQPEARGEVWVRGRGVISSFDLRKDGTYVSSVNCDICPENQQAGTWRRGGERLVLTEAGGSVEHVFVEVKYRGCNGLVPEKKVPELSKLFPTDIYFRWHDECPRDL
ncbi:hypothetical protein [Lysobacter sp. ESA13C]|uniref:hypothetical protein n=1 Tax=Lysobacter sp. ESA13C TaxID=2862676 RepID=UPI001CBDB562|nr:hypothetical protein [Lysobacter sp. ESA13C]